MRTMSVPLIVYDAEVKLSLSVSGDTVTRALNAMGYTYKRPSKTIPARAPNKKEKAARVQAMIEEVRAILFKGDTEIYALDESHFSTEPYLVRGWLKKGGHHKIETSYKRESLTFFGALNLVTWKFYWKEACVAL